MIKPNFDIVLYGGPAAGKGTQAKILSQKISAKHISMGAALRELSATDTDLGREVKSLIDEGHLVAPEIVAKLANDFVKAAGDAQVIFDGYPRDTEQLASFNQILANHGRDVRMVYIDLPTDMAVARITQRAEQEHRPDDLDPQVVAERIEVFHSHAAALLDYFKTRNQLITIDGDGTVEEVADRLFESIQNATTDR